MPKELYTDNVAKIVTALADSYNNYVSESPVPMEDEKNFMKALLYYCIVHMPKESMPPRWRTDPYLICSRWSRYYCEFLRASSGKNYSDSRTADVVSCLRNVTAPRADIWRLYVKSATTMSKVVKGIVEEAYKEHVVAYQQKTPPTEVIPDLETANLVVNPNVVDQYTLSKLHTAICMALQTTPVECFTAAAKQCIETMEDCLIRHAK